MSQTAFAAVPSRFADHYATPQGQLPMPFCTETVFPEDLFVYSFVTDYICEGETTLAACPSWKRFFWPFAYRAAVKAELEAARRLARSVRSSGGPYFAALCRIANACQEPTRKQRLLEIANFARNNVALHPLG